MKRAKLNVFRSVKVLVNGARKGDKWAKIVDADSGKTLHVGQVRYIKRVARKRYNVNW